MSRQQAREHVDQAIAHLDEIDHPGLKYVDLAPEDVEGDTAHVYAAWQELQHAWEELESDDARDLSDASEIPGGWGGHVEHRLGQMEDRLVAVEEKVGDLVEGFRARVRGTSRLDPAAPDATLTELLQRLRERVDAAPDDPGKDDGVIQHLEGEVERLATGQQALREKIGGPDGPWHASIAERFAQANRNIRRLLKRVDALSSWLDLDFEATADGGIGVVSTVDVGDDEDGTP